MTRQVNLWRNQQLPGYGRVQLPVFVLAFVVSLLAAALWFGYSWNKYEQKLQEEAEWQQRAEASLQALTLFQSSNPDLGNEARLQEINRQYAGQLQRSREAYSGLVNQVENAIEGFTGPLAQLSNYDINGLWLNSILLRDGHRAYTLEGFARRPELIPEYLNQLSQSTFKGLTVEKLSVNKETDKSSLWRFVMSNDATNQQRQN
ncbi:hypothetical protein [Reinekea marinisedimentorum]|uniref:Fimbrial assembly protein PilN n=1 Tax=Reinekea marinisedimentorum TaxID=230495 RepID=A0A4R3IA67_9GAMM|nr:hypothetical protein [Reinekea marinisedimentorum]TCS43180.1 hypothetical protein BCF53_102206 [Reinekea marinisedimentorum]